MAHVDSQPIEILRWALDNLSPAEVERSSQVRESFQEFLRRGTVPQLQQLLMEVREIPCDAVVSTDDGNNMRNPSFRRKQSFLHAFPSRKGTHRSPIRADSVEVGTSLATMQSTASASPLSSHSDTVFSPNTRGFNGYVSPSEGTIPSSYFGSPQHGQIFVQSACSSPLLDNPSPKPNLLLGNLHKGSSHDILCRAKKFFNARMGSRRTRINYLVRSIQGFVEAPALAADFAEDLWSSRSAIFVKPATSNCSTRLQSLYEGHRKIKGARDQHPYAARFCYIYLEHDLEALSQSQVLVLSQGRGKMTAAFELQAEIISTTVDVVKSERKAGRGYLQLLMEGGPGFILRLGRNVSTLWERKLSSSDISLIIEFLRTETPDLFDKIKSYDESAAKAFLDGFIAYGWTLEEILSSKSSLFQRLKEYVNLDGILYGNTNGVIPHSPQLTSASISSGLLHYPNSHTTSAGDNQKMSNAGMSLTSLPHEPVDNYVGPPEYSLLGPEIIEDLWEMSASELDSILAQTDELTDVQNLMDLSTWVDCFTEDAGGFW